MYIFLLSVKWKNILAPVAHEFLQLFPPSFSVCMFYHFCCYTLRLNVYLGYYVFMCILFIRTHSSNSCNISEKLLNSVLPFIHNIWVMQQQGYHSALQRHYMLYIHVHQSQSISAFNQLRESLSCIYILGLRHALHLQKHVKRSICA